MMDLPDELTSFWSAQVKPGRTCKITVPAETDVVLSNAALAQESGRPETGKVTLMASVNGDDRVAIIPFTINSFESSMLDVQFGEGDVVIFTTIGENCPIHISGYINGGYALSIEEDHPIMESSVLIGSPQKPIIFSIGNAVSSNSDETNKESDSHVIDSPDNCIIENNNQ